MINLRSSDNTMIGVKIKITNTSGKDINSADELYKGADDLLYQAKKLNRNNAVINT